MRVACLNIVEGSVRRAHKWEADAVSCHTGYGKRKYLRLVVAEAIVNLPTRTCNSGLTHSS